MTNIRLLLCSLDNIKYKFLHWEIKQNAAFSQVNKVNIKISAIFSGLLNLTSSSFLHQLKLTKRLNARFSSF